MISRADLSTLWLLGDPVEHSMSPLIQNTALKELGEKAVYLASRVSGENFEEVARALPKMGAWGANVTVPHKIRAFELCEELSPEAQAMGAVNTLYFREGRIFGHNTDGLGWWSSLRAATSAEFTRALVIGAGGASRAVCHTLSTQGVPEIVVLNRTLERAQSLVRDLQCEGVESRWEASTLSRFEDFLQDATLVVQTTSVGLHGEGSPVELPAKLPRKLFFSELIYGRTTPLMADFESRGVETLDGLGMLIGQAAHSLALWTGRGFGEIPVSLMTGAARQFLSASTK